MAHCGVKTTSHPTPPPLQRPPVFLSEKELAERWQRTPMTLLRMRRAGALPFVRIGKSPRYRVSDIERIETDGAA